MTSFSTNHITQVFPSQYHVTGLLKLPYGKIEEPFEANHIRDDIILNQSQKAVYEGVTQNSLTLTLT